MASKRWRWCCLSGCAVPLLLVGLAFARGPLMSAWSGLGVRQAVRRAGITAARVVRQPEPAVIPGECREEHEMRRLDRFFGRGLDEWDVYLAGEAQPALWVASELGQTRPLAVHYEGRGPVLPAEEAAFERAGAALLARWYGVAEGRLTLVWGRKSTGPGSSGAYWQVEDRQPYYLAIYLRGDRVSQLSRFARCPVRPDRPLAPGPGAPR